MDVVDTLKKEITDMNVSELIEKIIKTTKIAALELRKTNKERINECAQEMRDIRLFADNIRLRDAVDNIGVAFRVMEMLTETNNTRSVKDIVSEMLDNDDESLTDVSEYDSDSADVSFYISDSDQ